MQEINTHADFEKEFRRSGSVHGIRVIFDWGQFHSKKWPISNHPLVSQEKFGQIFLPWYLDQSEENEIGYDQPGSKPLRLCDIPSKFDALCSKHQDDINKYVEKFREDPKPIQFRAATYTLPNSQFIVMDGNHRLSALTLLNESFEVLLCNVQGPLNRNYLADLRHWDGQS